MILNDDAFREKAQKLADLFREEDPDGFYLGRITDWDNTGVGTIFGTGNIVFRVPVEIGEPEKNETAQSVLKLVDNRFLELETQRQMRSVELPKIGDIRLFGTKTKPAYFKLTGKSIKEDEKDDTFYVQARYLKRALQLARFDGWRAPGRRTPLYLYVRDLNGCWADCFIMLFWPKDGDKSNG